MEMTLPDTPFVCENIDVIWWCEEHRCAGDSAATPCEYWFADSQIASEWGVGPADNPKPCRMVERGLVDLSEVIPAEVETQSDCQGCIDGEDRHKWQPVGYEERFITEWRPV
jgi:hypothetical protein